MFERDRQWIVTETRAAAAIFHSHSDEAGTDAEHFEVDGTTVWFTVQ